MTLIRCLALAALLVPTGAWAKTVQCPVTLKGAALAAVDLYDGPLDEHADLAPDRSSETRRYRTARWNVGYIHKAGRRLFVDCQYGMDHLVLQPPADVQRCLYREARRGTKSLQCT